MSASKDRRSALMLIVTLALTLSALLSPALARRAHADVVGNTYTSQEFGYSVTWDESWVVLEASSDPYDVLTLSNGIGFAIMGGETAGGNAQFAVLTTVVTFKMSSSVSDVEELPASDGIPGKGGDSTRAFNTVAFKRTYDDGSTQDLIAYIEARTIDPASSVFIFTGMAPSDYFPIAMPGFQALLDSVVIPGASTAAPGAAPLLKGEPAPVFMAGQWRIGIAAAAQGDSLDDIGLAAKPGKEWVAVVLDVTNWGAVDAAFPADQVFARMQESSTKSKVATGSTGKAANALGLPATPDVEIKVGETQRIVLVFQVSAGRTAPSLIFGEASMPISDQVRVSMKPDAIGAPAGPPDLQQATLIATSSEGTIKVQYDGESKTHRVALLGVDTVDTRDAAKAEIMRYAGEPVWIETDDSVTTSGTPAVYLWVEDDDGTRVLLNQQLIADGVAVTAPIPDDARFAAWLSATAIQAAVSTDTSNEATPATDKATPVAAIRPVKP